MPDLWPSALSAVCRRATALNAARIAMASGVSMVITNGERMEDIYGIVAGEPIGTRFKTEKDPGREDA